MARVLITGANGFTGKHLTDRLTSDGHELFGLVRHNHPDDVGPQIMSYAADLCDQQAVERIVEALQPDRVVHLAAVANVAYLDVAEMYSTNILGTRNLLQALANLAKPPAAVLVASSANVYGNRQEGTLSEDLPHAPVNDYGMTKVACEALVRLYSDRLPIITARPFNYTGRGQSRDFLIPKIVAHIRSMAPTIELGNLDVARDFSDVRAVVESYARLLDAPAAIGGVFNVCSGRVYTLAEIIALAEQVSGHRLEVQINPAFVRADEVKSLRGSPARLEHVIGRIVNPELIETIEWMLND